MTVQQYIINFLLNEKDLEQFVSYESLECLDNLSKQTRLLIIQSNFFHENVYGTEKSIPLIPFNLLPNTDIPFLFGESKIEYKVMPDGHKVLLLYADLVASAFFLLSRYEEIVKPESRDEHGRFLSKDSIIFQQGYGMRPLVDEWGCFLRGLLRETGVDVEAEKHGLQKIYLTHDVDCPFLFYRKEQVVKQWIKNILHYGIRIKHPLYIYKHPERDPQNTFEKIVDADNKLKIQCGKNIVESIFFLIAAGSRKTKLYCDIQLSKFKKLIQNLSEKEASIGLHVSYEAGDYPNLIELEMQRLQKEYPNSCTKSRHHFLHWIQPEHIIQMEQAGITEDFTLGYADSVGFRVGTCHPYYFINPITKQLTNVLIHPMQIMECSLDRHNYMGLEYEQAFDVCKQLINLTKKFNGELVLLFHNPIWNENNYYGKLYEELLTYISQKMITS